MQNRAGLYWYHAHPHHRTGFQLQYGLAVPLLVDDAEELALREKLGLAWGVHDVPLFIADKQIDAGNAIVYNQGADDWIGNRVLVNWTPEPYFDVVQGLLASGSPTPATPACCGLRSCTTINSCRIS